jgi:hypothetical protein
MKVEVFKTNVADPNQAKWLVDQIERNFTGCKVNFDLDDCDRILRIVFEEKIRPDSYRAVDRSAKKYWVRSGSVARHYSYYLNYLYETRYFSSDC